LDEAQTARQTSPAAAWREMVRGNERFIAGAPRHPRQDVERRQELIGWQAPHAALFGCSDSRLAAEIIFDKGIGDLFVIRNAGQVVTDSALGSIEYAVAILNVPLIVVLGHDECGAVQAAIDVEEPDAAPLPPYIDGLVQRIVPAVREAHAADRSSPRPNPSEVGRLHLRHTIEELLERSEIVSAAVAAGTLAVVSANYRLAEGRVVADTVVGII
jgi:carbonic anhydrase